MGAGFRPLPALEIAIGGADDPLAVTEVLAAGVETHGAAGGAPLEARRGENPVQALGLRLGLDLHGARHANRAQPGGDPPALQHGGRQPQVTDTAVGAGTDKGRVDGDTLQRQAGLQAHVGQRPFPARAIGRPGCVQRRHRGGDRHRVLRAGTPGNLRLQC